MTKVSIIIPTLFPPPTLQEYAERLAKYRDVCEVIVVINAVESGQWSVDSRQTKVKIIHLDKNKGFTGACNAGAREAKGKYLLFLNDDCEMDEENFEKMVKFLEKNLELVATQPVVYKRKSEQWTVDSEQMKNNNKVSLPAGQAGLDETRDDERREIENIGFYVDVRIGKAFAVTDLTTVHSSRFTVHSIYGLSGTCLLIRKEIFEKIGMWDESFHSYLEDVDLAIRMHKFGYKFAPCIDSEVTHAHMATSKQMGMYKPVQDVKNWWRLIMKHPDVFVHASNLIPLLLERGRNVSGVIKAIRSY